MRLALKHPFAWPQSLEEWMLLVYTDQMYQYWDLRETKEEISIGSFFSFSFENVEESMNWIHLSIYLAEKDKGFKGSASCFGIVPIVPMFLKHIAHLELFGSEHPLSSPRYLSSHLIYSKIFRLFPLGSHFKASRFKSELNSLFLP